MSEHLAGYSDQQVRAFAEAAAEHIVERNRELGDMAGMLTAAQSFETSNTAEARLALAFRKREMAGEAGALTALASILHVPLEQPDTTPGADF